MLAITLALACLSQLAGGEKTPERPTPERKAIAFLSVEVPRWSREKHCFSCHNNGDAARALLHASQAGENVSGEALSDTIAWLQKPAGWNHNGGDGPNNDRRLARIAFSAALATAVSTGRVRDKSGLVQAAEALVRDQDADGSWRLEGEDATGAPATYGRSLATLLARQSLAAADSVRFKPAIERADRWLQKQDVQNVIDASVSLLAFAAARGAPAGEAQKRSLEVLARAQDHDGGWGPDRFSPPEPFDTALALLALASCEPTATVRTMIARGRSFLIAEQHDDGSWTETTRPAGNVSYAERISTTGWATMGLIATADRKTEIESGDRRSKVK
jgi:hypothetical protein